MARLTKLVSVDGEKILLSNVLVPDPQLKSNTFRSNSTPTLRTNWRLGFKLGGGKVRVEEGSYQEIGDYSRDDLICAIHHANIDDLEKLIDLFENTVIFDSMNCG